MIELKIDDVFHEEADDVNTSIVESRIEGGVESGERVEVENVRVALGNMNSPIFIKINDDRLSMDKLQAIAREALVCFERHYDGVDVEKTAKRDNLIIKATGSD